MHIKPQPDLFVKAETLDHLYSPPLGIKRERATSAAGIKQEDIKPEIDSSCHRAIKQEDIKPESDAFPKIRHGNNKPELPIIKQKYIQPEAESVLEIKREHIQPQFPIIPPGPEVRQAVPAPARRVVTERLFAPAPARYVPPDHTDLAGERRRTSRRASRQRQRQAKLARQTPAELLAKKITKREKILEKRRKRNRAAKQGRGRRGRQEALLQQTPTPQPVAPVHDAGPPHLLVQPHAPSGARFTSYDYTTRRGADRDYPVISTRQR